MKNQSPRFALDIMKTDLITARPEMTSEELQELLVMNRISGAPVVNAENQLVGVISMSDLLGAGANLPYTAGYFEAARLDVLLEGEGFHVENLTSGFVEEFMTRQVITAHPGTRIEELASMMYNNHIHRVIVVSPYDRRVLGIVTTFDLIRLIADRALKGDEPTRETQATGA